MTENIVCETRLKKYGAAAFMRHKEEVCLAVRAVCFCLEFSQNQEKDGSQPFFRGGAQQTDIVIGLTQNMVRQKRQDDGSLVY